MARKLLIVINFLLTTSLLQGCTTYGKMGFTGGVSHYQLNADTYKVFAKGNAFVAKEKIEQFVLLRSAEFAKENGFESFGFINSASGHNVSSYTTTNPGTFNGNVYGNHFHGTYTAPTSRTNHYNKPYSEAVVRMFNDNQGTFDTEFILSNLSHFKK